MVIYRRDLDHEFIWKLEDMEVVRTDERSCRYLGIKVSLTEFVKAKMKTNSNVINGLGD